MLLTEEFPLSSHCIWSLCTPPPHHSMPARALGTLGAPLIHLEHGSLGKGFGFLCFTPGPVLRTWLLGEVVWAAGFLLPRCLGDTVPACFPLFPLGSWWHPVCFRWCRKTGWQTQPRSFIPVDGLYLESNLQNTCVQGCIYSCYRHQLWSFSHLCLCLDGLI